MATNPVALILGAGPRVGTAVAAKFVSAGYKVAVVSRKGTQVTKGVFSLKADFNKPESLPAVFDTVKSEFHAAPSVIIYNAAAMRMPPNPDSMFSIEGENVALDLNVNTVSPYVAAQQAIAGWETLPEESMKTFIYTGNILNVSIPPLPMMMNLGMGKSASAYWIGLADAMYSAKGFRFFYADERQDDGRLKGLALHGVAHAEFFAQLAKHEGNVPWHATFVKDKGYVKFE